MNAANLWWQFWQLAFTVAVGSFATIAATVAVRGLSDLRALMQFLKREEGTPRLPRRD
jgi:hypothetical protein